MKILLKKALNSTLFKIMLFGFLFLTQPIEIRDSILDFIKQSTTVNGPVDYTYFYTITVIITALVSYAVYGLLCRVFNGEWTSPVFHKNIPLRLVQGMTLSTSILVGATAILFILGMYHIESFSLERFSWYALSMALWAGFFEEIVFRGVLQYHLEKRFGTLAAILVTASFFGFSHFGNTPDVTVSIISSIAIAVTTMATLSLVFTYTQSLWAVVAVHVSWNYIQGNVLGFAVSGAEFSSILQQTTTGSPIITGGSFGLETSLITFALCSLFGYWLLRKTIRENKWKPFTLRNPSNTEQQDEV